MAPTESSSPAVGGGAGRSALGAHQHCNTDAPPEWRELVRRLVREGGVMTGASELARALGGGKKVGREYRCTCPAHDDKHPSLDVRDGDNGTVLVTCRAGCSQESVIAALRDRGLWGDNGAAAGRPKGMFATAKNDDGVSCKLSSWWTYRSEDGAELGHVARYDPPTGTKKTFRPFFKQAGGEWKSTTAETSPLYNLDKLAARPDAPVLVAEGEKACDAAARLLPDYVAVTWPCGGKSARCADWSPLSGRTVTVWRDNDAAGRKTQGKVLAELAAVGCTDVAVVDVDALELPETGDAADLAELPAGELPTVAPVELAVTSDNVTSEETDQEQPAVRGRLLADLVKDPSVLEPVEPLVPKVAWPEHVTLLAGREKRGKSTLSTAAVAAVTNGSPFLDGVARQGTAFWVGADREHEAGVIRRAVAFNCNPEHTIIETTFGADPVAELERAVEYWEPDLIIIDKLSGLAMFAVKKFNDPEQWLQLFERIIAIARAGPGVVLVAEAGKNTGEYAYSNVIGGRVDALLTLRRDTADPQHVRKVEAIGRRLEGLDDFAWRLGPDGDSVELVGGTGQSLELRIVQFVLAHPRCSKSAVHDHVGGNRRAVLSMIDKLLATASLVDQGDGSRSELVVPYD